jgi:hypothetical protein
MTDCRKNPLGVRRETFRLVGFTRDKEEELESQKKLSRSSRLIRCKTYTGKMRVLQRGMYCPVPCFFDENEDIGE